MKRTDMLNIIKSCIKLNHFDEANQYSRAEISLGRFAEICAETILNRIESEGMRPPVTGSLISQMAAAHNKWEDE